MGGRAFSQDTHTHHINTCAHTNGAVLVSSVIRELAGGSETHTHTQSVVSAVVKSHCSKEPGMFDQHYERTAQASGRPARAAICSHLR